MGSMTLFVMIFMNSAIQCEEPMDASFFDAWRHASQKVHACEGLAFSLDEGGTVLNVRQFASMRGGRQSWLASKGESHGFRVHGVKDESWRKAVFQHVAYTDGTNFSLTEPLLRTIYHVPAEKANVVLDKIESNILWNAYGWWFSKSSPDLTEKGDVPTSVQQIVDSGKYSVQSVFAEMDGRRLRVVEWPGRDTLWVDESRGYVIMRREVRDGTLGGVIDDMTMNDVREVKDGIWLPHQIHLVRRLGRKGDDGADAVRKAEITVLELRVNEDVTAKSLEPPPILPGTLEISWTTGRVERQEPGGFDHMDYIAAEITEKQSFSDEWRKLAQSRQRSLLHSLLLFPLTLVGLAAAFVGVRKSFKRSVRPPATCVDRDESVMS